ncbi:cysteine desulfurase-like protein [Daejeonella lutea]|uniref:Cysteine desulfurase family protein, VC1184 subfamily n=1 Tax=Daejeonella lutea TaxID=572036 RepID=A0A1T5BCU4_9SPHI|nr:cysteine desulfurase-like protein [Daejeonella lutea]SKB44839.1 cysteine desulfurase family protein, VC1184 subfamily [Daejeonella lutea]
MIKNSFDIEGIRSQFPSLKRNINGNQAIYLDSPGGTQTPQRVIDKMVDYMINHNANSGGVFATTVETDSMILETRKSFADFFNCSPEEISFGENSTTLNFKLSQAIARDLKAGDEIIITDIDHDANRSPWEILAERGVIVQSVRVNTETLTIDLEDYKRKLTQKTKVVAFNYGSNAVGTISDAKTIIDLAKTVKAITVVDAVHFALHGVLDVKELDADFVFCSAYKFFGPHIGVLYSKSERMNVLKTLKVSAQKNYAPDKFETGTLNHEAIAGAAEAIEFIADIGRKHPEHILTPDSVASQRRNNIISGMRALEAYEIPLAEYFKDELKKIKGLGLFSPPKGHLCTSTISFRLEDLHPLDVAKSLAEKGIFVWAGGFYAVGLMRALGLSESGGLVRIGLAPYNTKDEIDRTLSVVKVIAGS